MGTILTIISLFVQAIKLSPQILSLVQAVAQLIRMLFGKGFNVKGFIVRFEEAIHVAKNQKDSSKLEALMHELVDYCHSSGVCPLGDSSSPGVRPEDLGS